MEKVILNKYKNGNTEVTIYSDGTKIREYKGEPIPEFPESIDIKMTNFCDLADFCQWCLVNGTLISTPNGFMEIEEVKLGQKVFSFDVKKQKIVEDIVEELFEREIEEDIYFIELEGGKTLKITGNHEIYVEGKGWILSSDLIEGDEVLDLRI